MVPIEPGRTSVRRPTAPPRRPRPARPAPPDQPQPADPVVDPAAEQAPDPAED